MFNLTHFIINLYKKIDIKKEFLTWKNLKLDCKINRNTEKKRKASTYKE